MDIDLGAGLLIGAVCTLVTLFVLRFWSQWQKRGAMYVEALQVIDQNAGRIHELETYCERLRAERARSLERFAQLETLVAYLHGDDDGDGDDDDKVFRLTG